MVWRSSDTDYALIELGFGSKHAFVTLQGGSYVDVEHGLVASLDSDRNVRVQQAADPYDRARFNLQDAVASNAIEVTYEPTGELRKLPLRDVLGEVNPSSQQGIAGTIAWGVMTCIGCFDDVHSYDAEGDPGITALLTFSRDFVRGNQHQEQAAALLADALDLWLKSASETYAFIDLVVHICLDEPLSERLGSAVQWHYEARSLATLLAKAPDSTNQLLASYPPDQVQQAILREIRILQERLDPMVERLIDVDLRVSTNSSELARLGELNAKLLASAQLSEMNDARRVFQSLPYWKELDSVTRREIEAAEVGYQSVQRGKGAAGNVLAAGFLYCRPVDREWNKLGWRFAGRSAEYKRMRNDLTHGRPFSIDNLERLRSLVLGLEDDSRPELLPDPFDPEENERRADQFRRRRRR